VDALTRERFDRTWSLYPYEHPTAYWLRSDGRVILCLRCSSRMEPRLDEDPTEQAEAFTSKHLSCPEGFGLRGSAPRAAHRSDPLFAAFENAQVA
jgi:hypothetical protein